MSQIGWRLLQLAIFAVLFFALIFSGRTPGEAPSGKDAAGVFLVAGAATVVLFAIINQVQNWLIRRRARMVGGGVDLAQKSDRDRDRLGRAWPAIDEPAEIIEVTGREQPRKLRGPLP